MKTFYLPEAEWISRQIQLGAEESHHAVQVLRVRAGEKVSLLNGKGLRLTGTIERPDAKACIVSILEREQEAVRECKVHIALALLKKRDRMEWFIEKAVELGADEISIFESEHTEKGRLDMERMRKIAISALKQSGNLWLPEVHGVLKFPEIVKRPFAGEKFIAYCPTAEEQLLKKLHEAGKNAMVLIGPEGDFSPKEVEEALRHDFRSVSLGKLRLRAETAALTALLTLQVLNQ